MQKRFPTVAPPPSAPTVNVSTQAGGAPQLGRWTQTTQSDVEVPLKQAAWGGLLFGLCACAAGGMIIYWQRWPAIDAAPLMLGGCIIVGVVSATAWYIIQVRAVQRTWWNAELLIGRDINGDGLIGQPDRLDVGAVRTHKWTEQDKRDAEALRRLRFEEFIGKLYRAGKTDTDTIRSLGFSEPERKAFIEALRDANVIRATRKGDAAGWVFLPRSADACIELTRQRVMFMSRASSSSSSSGA